MVVRYEQDYSSLEQRSPAALALFAALDDEQPLGPCIAAHLELLRSGGTGADIAMTDE
jgi:hypothetical protein